MPGDDFEKVDGTDIDTGLVIKDKKGNEWVWIEVPQTETVYPTAKLNITEFTDDECNTIYNDLKVYTVNYSEDSMSNTMENAENVGGFSKAEYYKLRNDILKSKYSNGGFWLARYEAGVKNSSDSSSLSDVKIYSKKGYYPYENERYVEQMQKLSESINSGNHSSSLMFGVQWDLILKFIETKGALTQDQIKNNCYNWGNFINSTFSVDDPNAKECALSGEWISISSNTSGTGILDDKVKSKGQSILLTTGASSRNSVLNIYDLAGNVCEQTLEVYYMESFVFRGGQARWDGIYANASEDGGAYYRGAYNAISTTGFRPIMY